MVKKEIVFQFFIKFAFTLAIIVLFIVKEIDPDFSIAYEIIGLVILVVVDIWLSGVAKSYYQEGSNNTQQNAETMNNTYYTTTSGLDNDVKYDTIKELYSYLKNEKWNKVIDVRGITKNLSPYSISPISTRDKGVIGYSLRTENGKFFLEFNCISDVYKITMPYNETEAIYSKDSQKYLKLMDEFLAQFRNDFSIYMLDRNNELDFLTEKFIQCDIEYIWQNRERVFKCIPDEKLNESIVFEDSLIKIRAIGSNLFMIIKDKSNNNYRFRICFPSESDIYIKGNKYLKLKGNSPKDITEKVQAIAVTFLNQFRDTS